MLSLISEPKNAIHSKTFCFGVVCIKPFKLTLDSGPDFAVVVALQLTQYFTSGHSDRNVSAFIGHHVAFGFDGNPER